MKRGYRMLVVFSKEKLHLVAYEYGVVKQKVTVAQVCSQALQIRLRSLGFSLKLPNSKKV